LGLKPVSTESGSAVVGLEGVSRKFELEIRLHKVHGRIQVGSKAVGQGVLAGGMSWEADLRWGGQG